MPGIVSKLSKIFEIQIKQPKERWPKLVQDNFIKSYHATLFLAYFFSPKIFCCFYINHCIMGILSAKFSRSSAVGKSF